MSQVPGVDDRLVRWGSYALLALAVLVSAAVVSRLSDDDSIVAPLQDRFVYGVPWGTALVVALVYTFYFLVQGGGQSGGPLVTSFRSWSLFAPSTILFSSFAHSSQSHLIGNLFGTVAFAPLVEWAWGHYQRGDEMRLLPDLLARPGVRIAAFVFGVFVVGVLGSLIVPGAVIGFSGVVFAFAGFAIITLPIRTVLAILGIGGVRLIWQAVRDPLIVARATPQFVQPSWANIAIQGHLYGLLVGVLLAIGMSRMRRQSPQLRHVWFAALVFAITRSMDALYWFLGNDTYILFRGLGTAAVLLLATLITAAAYDGGWQLVESIDLKFSTAAWGLLLALVLALAMIGIPYNIASVEGGEEVQNGVEVRDYTVTYAEDVGNRYISSVGLPVSQGPDVQQSGVIIASDSRNIWEVSTSARELAFEGETTVVVGDATWRETVHINRTTWRMSGGNSTYKVFGQRGGEQRQLLFAAESAVAAPTVNRSKVRIGPTPDAYGLAVTRNETVIDQADVPGDGKSIVLGGIEFERDGQSLLARHEGTELEIATYRLSRR